MRILIFANNDVGLYKFRKELIKELLVQDNKIFLSLPNGDMIQPLKNMGCEFIETNVDRRGTNPIKDFNLIRFYKKIIDSVQPDVVLTYTIKPNIYGGIACALTGTPYIANVTGLGTSIENKGLMATIVLKLYRIGFRKVSCVFFQNESNKQLFLDKHIVQSKVRLIPGSGVNLVEHCFEDYPDNDKCINFLFIARIMKAKGIEEFLQAAQRVKTLYPEAHFDIVGSSEEDYVEQILGLEKQGIIKYHGEQDDVHSFIKKAHATVLPSYHEGTSNVLLESAASGRPVLASRVTGCKETFDEGVSGIGFEVKDVDSLVEAIIKFIKLPHGHKKDMGVAGRRKIEREFNRHFVINAYMEEIDSLIN